jgi:RNA polymerase sigma-70 factor (ECF subfamily)
VRVAAVERVARRRRRSAEGGGGGLEELVEAARDGDARAFERLVRLTYADTYNLALRLVGNEHDACDVSQEAYLRAFRSITGFRREASFSTWMYRITANCASTMLARRARTAALELDAEAVEAEPNAGGDPEIVLDGMSERARVMAALDALPDSLRAVVVLRDVYDLPHRTIAGELGISQTAAKVRLHRARKLLREQLFPPAESAPADLLRAG